MSLTPDVIILALVAGLLVVAALSDWRLYLIPNRISLAILALFPVFALATPGMGLVETGLGLLVAAGVLVAMIGLWTFRIVGGGDAKLLAATSAFAGADHIVTFLIVVALANGVLALGQIVFGRVRFYLAVAGYGRGDTAAIDAPLPYGVGIGIGGLMVCWFLLNS